MVDIRNMTMVNGCRWILYNGYEYPLVKDIIRESLLQSGRPVESQSWFISPISLWFIADISRVNGIYLDIMKL